LPFHCSESRDQNSTGDHRDLFFLQVAVTVPVRVQTGDPSIKALESNESDLFSTLYHWAVSKSMDSASFRSKSCELMRHRYHWSDFPLIIRFSEIPTS
jgi:hypothetical protein